MEIGDHTPYLRVVLHRSRRRKPLIFCAAAVAAVSIALPAASETPMFQLASSSGTNLVPGLVDPGITAVTAQNPTVEVSRAKVQFSLPTLYVRGLYALCSAKANSAEAFPVAAGGIDDPVAQARCTKMFGLPLPAKYQDPNHQLAGGLFDGYFVSSDGPNPTYGTLPPTTAHALVFGSIPVTATVHLAQASKNGFIDPLRAQYFVVTQPNGGTDLGIGTPSYPGFGPLPPPPVPSASGLIVVRADIRTTFDVRLSDVKVDGHAVELGPNCTTRQPATLRFTVPLGPSGDYVDADGNLQRARRGTPASFDPVRDNSSGSPGTFDGVVNIPAFENCGIGQNLDSLLTSLISSPVNHVSGFVPYGLPDTRAGWCNVPIAHCSTAQVAAQKRVRALNSAMANHASPAVIRKLQARIRPSDYELPKVKAPKNLGK